MCSSALQHEAHGFYSRHPFPPTSTQNLDNYIPFRLADLRDSLIADNPEVRLRTKALFMLRM